MDHGGGRSSSRLRDRLARMFRPASLLRSTCNTTASTCSSSSSTTAAAGAGAASRPPPPGSACSSSRALLAADAAVARDRDSFLASSRRDYASLVGRTESFSTAVDRIYRRANVVAPAPPARFSLDTPPPPPESKKEKEKQKSPREHRLGGVKSDKTKAKLLSNPYGFSSSDDADADTDVFSSDADDLGGRGGGAKKQGESAETFFSSSRSFSSDSSEFYTKKTKKKKQPPSKKSPASSAAPKPPLPPPPPSTKRCQRRHRRAASSCDTCGVRDGFRPVVSAAEEQLRRGFAVVKRSRDPYADFRSSMVEMIVGRQMFGAPELERLLRSYLSLNAPRHHPVILQAFSDIWVVLHGS
ncbi:hypothetical protein ACP4OV_013333 [Aristida adscensionis]